MMRYRSCYSCKNLLCSYFADGTIFYSCSLSPGIVIGEHGDPLKNSCDMYEGITTIEKYKEAVSVTSVKNNKAIVGDPIIHTGIEPLEDLGLLNNWEQTPKIVMGCLKKGHERIICEIEYCVFMCMCMKCNYRYTVNSGEVTTKTSRD